MQTLKGKAVVAGGARPNASGRSIARLTHHQQRPPVPYYVKSAGNRRPSAFQAQPSHYLWLDGILAGASELSKKDVSHFVLRAE
jgi:hypothetical protein